MARGQRLWLGDQVLIEVTRYTSPCLSIRASFTGSDCSRVSQKRHNAEDPDTFLPSPGRITAWVPPRGPRVRVDSHVMAGYTIPPHYDSLIAKIIVHGQDRAEALARMHRALSETIVEGVKTTVPYHLKLLAEPAFLSGDFALPRLEHALDGRAPPRQPWW